MMVKQLVAGIDAGGSSFKLALASLDGGALDGQVLAETRVPTTTPQETIESAVNALRTLADELDGTIARVGIASFGPVDVDPTSPSYGRLLTTPKAGWSGFPLLSAVEDAFGVPGRLDTDVNAALQAEALWGAARGAERVAYVTVGTGIGVAVKMRSGFAARPFHPELGHVRVERHEDDRDFAGLCPFHGPCLEGLSAAPALTERFGPLDRLPADSDSWEVPAFYLAQLCLVLVLGFRVQCVVLGGGVMNAPSLLSRVRLRYQGLMNSYVQAVPSGGADFIVTAGLGDRAGAIGACLLAIHPDSG